MVMKTLIMTRNQSHDDHDHASSKKRFMTHDNGGATPPWSDLNHHLLSLVTMQLALVDFIAFNGVCKSWRSFALSERNRFFASRPLMSIYFIYPTDKNACYFLDFEGRMFKTILPNSSDNEYVRLTCGYLIFFSRETRDIWLVNPITGHELQFPDFPIGRCPDRTYKAILVFSPSLGFVFVVLRRYTHELWFSIAGKGAWNHVISTSVIYDIHAFKGKIYALISNPDCWLCEVRFSLEPNVTLLKLTSLETKYAPYMVMRPWFVSSGENLYVMVHHIRDQYVHEIEDRVVHHIREDEYVVHEIDFGEMKWVLCEKTIGEYAFFVSDERHAVAVNSGLWADPQSQYERFVDTYKSTGKGKFFKANMWYFFHECLNVDMIDE